MHTRLKAINPQRQDTETIYALVAIELRSDIKRMDAFIPAMMSSVVHNVRPTRAAIGHMGFQLLSDKSGRPLGS